MPVAEELLAQPSQLPSSWMTFAAAAAAADVGAVEDQAEAHQP